MSSSNLELYDRVLVTPNYTILGALITRGWPHCNTGIVYEIRGNDLYGVIPDEDWPGLCTAVEGNTLFSTRELSFISAVSKEELLTHWHEHMRQLARSL